MKALVAVVWIAAYLRAWQVLVRVFARVFVVEVSLVVLAAAWCRMGAKRRYLGVVPPVLFRHVFRLR